MPRTTTSTGQGLELWQEAERRLARGQGAEALALIDRWCDREPGNTGAHLMAAAVAHALGRLRESAAHAIDAADTDVDDAALLGSTITGLLKTGEVARARQCMEHPLLRQALPGRTLLGFASAMQAMGCHAEALALIDRALAGGMDDPGVRFQRSIELMFNGRSGEAEREVEEALASGLANGRASLMLSRQRRQTPERNHVDDIRRRIGRADPASEDRAALEFALYKEYEDLELHEEAWQALERGNRVMAGMLRPDAGAHTRRIDALIERTAARDRATASEPATNPQPIFIVGMPRSGTTLLDRILGAHTQVTSAGELGDFGRQLRWAADCPGVEPIDERLLERLDRVDFAEVGRRYLSQTRWRSATVRYIDKLPVNYQLAGLVARALPNARILHMVRDPMATCFSNYRAYFGAGYGYSYDLAALAAHHHDYRRLMRHWHRTVPGRILDVDYARLAADPEAALRDILEFCGLDFEPGCLDLRNNRAPVATLSAMQVGGGIRASEDDAWRRYAGHLSGLASALSS